MQVSLMANGKSESNRKRKPEKQLKIVQSYRNLPFTKVASVATSFGHTFLTSRASLVAQTVKNLPAMQEAHVHPLGQEDPLEKGVTTHSSIFSWRIHGERSLVRSQRVRHN